MTLNDGRSGGASGIGGESGIRTHGRVSPTHAFPACSFNHSDISPRLYNQSFTGEWMSPSTRIVIPIVIDLRMSCEHLRRFGPAWRPRFVRHHRPTAAFQYRTRRGPPAPANR